MQRLCTKVRSLAGQSTQILTAFSSSRRFIHTSQLRQPLCFVSASRKCNLSGQLLNTSSSPSLFQSPSVAFQSPLPPSSALLSLVHVRHVSSRERRKKRKPMTPVTSKVKKVKIKFYSSYKDRFRTMNDGTIRRWREGKNHNAHLKSKKSKRRLRKPSTVPAAYAKVMKKLNFCG
ncbi:uncharacterized protein LOC110604619 [Manihot esculenta]|uniref:50S ribosomal protein L35 n=1 Tax=Manihot esculenta TaxID=3983 RepID=A0A2C9U442_MANES|nr:uncharacterized protein LOC110604619 [Manihot esculenta]OAY24381.1 hypothetical protein MANES_17G011100v8 [Manihot esculenta]